MKQQSGGVINKPFDRKEIYETLHHEIADTYLKSPGLPGKSKEIKPKRVSRVPWVIAVIAVLLCLALLISKSNIEINVRILGEVPSVRTANDEGRFYNISEKGVYFLKGAEPNDILVKNTFFLGDARMYSKINGDQLILCNSKGSGWANYSIELFEPLDLKKLDLKFMARGECGQESLSITIVDKENRSYRLGKDRSFRLAREWMTYSVNFGPIKNAIDLKNISIIRFEFGSLTVGNGPVATIYLKDIYASKTKRIKWL